MGCQCEKGRHRAPTRSYSSRMLPTLLLLILPLAFVLGYTNLTTDSATQVGNVDPYAGMITIAARPMGITSELPDVETRQAQPPVDRGTNHTTPSSGSSEQPSEGATESPVTTSTQPVLPTTPGEDQEALTADSGPMLGTQKIQSLSNASCNGLNSRDNVVRACNAILQAFPQVSSVIGQAHRPKNPKSCHHRGMALDLMVTSNKLGDDIFAWAKAHKQEFGIGWMGWEVPDHFDHVHLSFEPCKG